MQHNDGTTNPENVQPMSKEDKEWLEKAMNEYTFNDADALQDLCKELKNDI